jgi:hypothetical protein
MNQRELDALYRSSPAAAIPGGVADGVALVVPGTVLTGPIARGAQLLAWKGKVFDSHRGQLMNRGTPFGVGAIRADVYPGTSLLDGRDSIILDYSRTSPLARWVRDEIREVSPGVYLGFAYAFGRRVISFALTFRD